MRLTLELISELYSRAGISHPEKYHDATISGSGLTMAIQFRFKCETRLRLFVTAGALTTKNLRLITEYYLEHFWGKPDTEYSSLLIAHIFAMLVEDYIKTCETEQQEEPDKDIIRDPGPESGAPPRGENASAVIPAGKAPGAPITPNVSLLMKIPDAAVRRNGGRAITDNFISGAILPDGRLCYDASRKGRL